MNPSIPTSNCKDLEKIWVRKQNRSPNNVKNPREIIGIDTETENGDIFLIADSDGNYLDDEITFEKIARFLFKHEGKWIFFYNLAYDAECILKLLPEKILKTYKPEKNARSYKPIRDLKFECDGFGIFYIPRKKLTISKNHHSVNCYDIAQYYDNAKLADAYSKNIGELSSEYLQMKQKRNIFSKFYYSRNKTKIREYCIQDCILTKELAGNWVSVFYKVFGFYPANWISAGYLAEKVLINNDVYVPRFNETDYAVQELARKSFYGGRFELIRRGYIGKCYLYDINSAYPYALTTMPDILDGNWFSAKKILPDAKIGFFCILADVPEDVKIVPFPFRKKNKTICYPSGQFCTYLTLDELRAIKNPKIRYKILESYQFVPNQDCKYPFREFIKEEYEKRMRLKQEDNPLQLPIKIILNSIYGKTAQTSGNRFGNLFNPIIASYITGFARAQLYSFVVENDLENDVVAFATDSVASRKKIEGLDSMRLGEMKLDKSGTDAIFLSNGFYRINDTWKKRGVGYDNVKKQEIEHMDSRIDEDGQFYIMLGATKMTHIKSGILFNRLKDVGKIEQYERKINLNSDRKRLWIPAELMSLSDGSSCDSVPMPIDLVGKMVAKDDVEWFEDEKYEPESDF